MRITNGRKTIAIQTAELRGVFAGLDRPALRPTTALLSTSRSLGRIARHRAQVPRHALHPRLRRCLNIGQYITCRVGHADDQRCRAGFAQVVGEQRAVWRFGDSNVPRSVGARRFVYDQASRTGSRVPAPASSAGVSARSGV